MTFPKNLLGERKFHRMLVTEDCLQQVENDFTLLHQVIIGDESLFFQYDPKMKHQSQQWLSTNTLRPKKARMNKSKQKIMLICFLDSRGEIHREFISPGQTVN